MKKETTAQRLKYIMKTKRLRQIDIIEACKPYSAKFGAKIQRSDLSQYVSGKTEPGQRKLTVLAYALGVSETWLMGYDESHETLANIATSKRTIPLLGEVAAGQPIFSEEHIEAYLPIDDAARADFAVRVQGQSMIEAKIYDGDIVLIRKQPDVDDGQIAIVAIDDEYTLKRVYHMPGALHLLPANPAYKPIVCTADNCSSCRIVGLAVSVLHKLL